MENRSWKESSWHAELATIFLEKKRYNPNICYYLRQVFWGFIRTLCVTLIASGILICIVDAVMYFVVFWRIDNGSPHASGILAVVIGCLVGAVVGIGLTVFLVYTLIRFSFDYTYKLLPKPSVKKQSFLSAAFESISNKICFDIDWEK